MRTITINFKNSIKAILFYSLILGGLYPFVLTLFSHIFLKEKSEGSLVYKGDHVIGSKLIAQKFDCKKYFCARASSVDFATIPSGASNLSPTSKVLLTQTSGSGLDPEISPQYALAQIPQITNSRKLKTPQIEALKNDIKNLTISATFGFLGIPRINVLELNLLLDRKYHD